MSTITVRSTINAPLQKVWKYWTDAAHVVNWNFASPDWHCPVATTNFRAGGEFHYTMAARDNSFSFDFWGTFQQIVEEKVIEILIGDGRKLTIQFEETSSGTAVTEIFEPEDQNPIEMQQAGWQMILDNFKNYVER